VYDGFGQRVAAEQAEVHVLEHATAEPESADLAAPFPG
jgi:hypothetical protein